MKLSLPEKMCAMIFLLLQAPETTYLEMKGTKKFMAWALYKHYRIVRNINTKPALLYNVV